MAFSASAMVQKFCFSPFVQINGRRIDDILVIRVELSHFLTARYRTAYR